jgi:hydrogenase nickel incorporation protein HypB
MLDTLEIKHNIIESNSHDADGLRNVLAQTKTFMVNVMASPGAGKTTTILALIEAMKKDINFAVVEGDIESFVDSEKVKEAGVCAVQIQTGGACHLDVSMLEPAIELIELDETDCVFVENIGNLVCPAEFDLGADINAMVLSVPEGHDKIQKYPLMFSMCDVLIINKCDYLTLPSNNFSTAFLRERMAALNPRAALFEISAYTHEGIDELAQWLYRAIKQKQQQD